MAPERPIAIVIITCIFMAIAAIVSTNLDFPVWLYEVSVFGTMFLVPVAMSMSYARSERLVWNNGLCTHCGSAWMRFEFTSALDTGYKCQCAGRVLWMQFSLKDRACKTELKSSQPVVAK